MAATAGGPVLSSGAVEPTEAFVFNGGSSLESHAVAGQASLLFLASNTFLVWLSLWMRSSFAEYVDDI